MLATIKQKINYAKNYLSSNIVDDICAAGKYLKIKIIFFYKKTLLLLKFFLSI